MKQKVGDKEGRRLFQMDDHTNNKVRLIDRQALYTDESADYRTPEEPDAGDQVLLRFRTAKGDAYRVYYMEIKGGKAIKEAEMKRISSDWRFDYYQHKITVKDSVLSYVFRVECGEDICYYDRQGVISKLSKVCALRILPGFHTPEWAKGAVLYQIFVDRFYNGDKRNDVESGEYFYMGRPVTQAADWDEDLSVFDVGRFYGGDLKGVWEKLDYLQELGIEGIYFNPLFVSPSNHKYDTQDYEHIDPHYGVIVKDGEPSGECHEVSYRTRSTDPANLEASDVFFARFMEEVHKRGMKVILDGVFNHCGSFHKWMDREGIYECQKNREEQKGAYRTEKSRYCSYFKFTENTWPENKRYESWWGNDTLPKLNYEDSSELCDYIIRIGRKWVSPPYNADGWRLDVAADLGHSPEFNHRFWQDFCREVKAANPQALILAEHYGDPGEWLQGNEWDTVMNYDAFMEPLTWFLTGMEKHSAEYKEELLGDGRRFFEATSAHMSHMPQQSLMTAMNQLSNHDHSRFLTRTNRTEGSLEKMGAKRAEEGVSIAVYREAVMVQMTWPGAPTIYYGDETGMCGWTDPDCRRPYPWKAQDKELIQYHKYLIGFHKRLPALRLGSVKPLAAKDQIIAYGRMRGENRCVVVLNHDERVRNISLPVWKLGIADNDGLSLLIQSDADGYHTERAVYYAENGILRLQLPPISALLFVSGVVKNN